MNNAIKLNEFVSRQAKFKWPIEKIGNKKNETLPKKLPNLKCKAVYLQQKKTGVGL